MIKEYVETKYDKDNPYIKKDKIRLFNLDLSDLKSLLINKEVLVIGYRYMLSGEKVVEYILLDTNNKYIYTVEKDFLDNNLQDIFKDLVTNAQLCILHGRKDSESEFYWLTNNSLKYILPSIELVDDSEYNNSNDDNYKNEVYINLYAREVDRIIKENFIEESNNVKSYNVKSYNLETYENVNVTSGKNNINDKSNLIGNNLLNKRTCFLVGFCAGNIFDIIFNLTFI